MRGQLTSPRAIALGVTLVYCLTVLPITSAIAFTEPADTGAVLRSYVLRGLFAAVLYIAVARAVALVRLLRRGDPDARFGVTVGAAHLAVLAALLLAVWPGQWMWDEYWVLEAARSYTLFSWQHYLTVVFHTLCLYLIPSGVGVVVVQTVLAAVVTGYLAARVRACLVHPRLAWLMVLPFLTLPALFEVMHPLRTTVYSLVAVMAIGRIVLLGWRPEAVGNRYRTMVGLAVLVTLMAFWRTEGLLYLALLPVVAARLGILGDLRRRPAPAAASLACSLVVVAAAGSLSASTSQPEYSVTALYNPLSVMVVQELDGGDVAGDLALIDTVVDVEHMRRYPDHADIPGFWVPGALRPDFREHMPEFYAGAASLFLHNPTAFVAARARTFLATHGLDPSRPQVETADLFLDASESPRVAAFEQTNAGAEPFAPGLREQVMRFLLGIDARGDQTVLRPLVWTVLPTLLGLLALAVAGLARRRWFSTSLVVALLLHAGLVVLTSPANYFMYYLPIYLVGNVLGAMAGVRLLDRRVALRTARVRDDRRPAEDPRLAVAEEPATVRIPVAA